MRLKVEVVTNQESSKKVTNALLALIEKYDKQYPISVHKTNKHN